MACCSDPKIGCLASSMPMRAVLLLGAVSAMEHELVRTMWGVPEFDEPGNWANYFSSLTDLYGGVEAPTWVVCSGYPSFDGTCMHACNETRAQLFKDALAAAGLFYIAQVHVCGVPIASADVDDAVGSLRAQALVAKDLGARFLNIHDGVDHWSEAQVLEYFGRAVALENEMGLVFAHETHRTRALATPSTTMLVLDHFPSLSLTADLSHWVIAAERAFVGGPASSGARARRLRRRSSVGLPERRGVLASDPGARRQPHGLDAREGRVRRSDPGQRPVGARAPGSRRDVRNVVERDMDYAGQAGDTGPHRAGVRSRPVPADRAAHELAPRRPGQGRRVHEPAPARPHRTRRVPGVGALEARAFRRQCVLRMRRSISRTAASAS